MLLSGLAQSSNNEFDYVFHIINISSFKELSNMYLGKNKILKLGFAN